MWREAWLWMAPTGHSNGDQGSPGCPLLYYNCTIIQIVFHKPRKCTCTTIIKNNNYKPCKSNKRDQHKRGKQKTENHGWGPRLHICVSPIQALWYIETKKPYFDRHYWIVTWPKHCQRDIWSASQAWGSYCILVDLRNFHIVGIMGEYVLLFGFDV